MEDASEGKPAMTPLTRAIHAACETLQPSCDYPECDCRRVPAAIRAALASVVEPSEGMIEAGAASLIDRGLVRPDLARNDAAVHWRAMHEKMMEEK